MLTVYGRNKHGTPITDEFKIKDFDESSFRLIDTTLVEEIKADEEELALIKNLFGVTIPMPARWTCYWCGDLARTILANLKGYR